MWRKNFGTEEFLVTTDQAKLDVEVIHRFLATESYWARGIPRATLESSLRHSLCFGIFHQDQQVGFARVISDHATLAYVADVFVLPAFRGRGLSKWLMECVSSHPDLQKLRRWILVTQDAHGLYKKFGFRELAHPERFMERHNSDVYAHRPGPS